MSERIKFDPEELRSDSKSIFNFNSTQIYNEIKAKTGVDKNEWCCIEFLKKLTRALVLDWNNNYLFLLWAELRERVWNLTLPQDILTLSEFEGVEERYQKDPRRRYVR